VSMHNKKKDNILQIHYFLRLEITVGNLVQILY
jgi:hypothetical protein